MSQKRINNKIEKFEMQKHQIHCSGHAKETDLLEIVKEIDAKMLFPIHTEHPTEYVRVTNKISIVDLNKKYNISK